MRIPVAVLTLALFLPAYVVLSQPADGVLENARISRLVEQYRTDQRGPYKDIRWFCPDGTTVAPRERCPQPGVQRARYRDEVVALGAADHIFLGQILATTDFEEFWDEAYGNSRIRQYQIENYLRQIDDGWINHLAQSYRGATQAEDEDAWGIAFFRWLLEDNNLVESQFFLVRQAVKDVPHQADDNVAQRVRTTAKEIADAYPPFMDLRVKIHGQPDEGDIERVGRFRQLHNGRLSEAVARQLDDLEKDIALQFSRANIVGIASEIEKLRAGSDMRIGLAEAITSFNEAQAPSARASILAKAALFIREHITSEQRATSRLIALDVSNRLEDLLLVNLASWKASTLQAELDRIEMLASAAAGFGFMELWEFEIALSELRLKRGNESTPLAVLKDYLDEARRIVEWSSLMVHVTYEEDVARFAGFEPLASGFYDEKIRSSILLPMGASIGRLGEFVAQEAGFSNRIFDIPNPAQARGLNPGYAKGMLVVVDGEPESVRVDASRIYVFNRPPSDLKPVAGIMTVTEGNLVSHVQLLARNLGIPNGVVSASNLRALLPYSGREVFMAVSNEGAIILKLAEEMSPAERRLFEVKARSQAKIAVPVERMDLTVRRVLTLAAVDATHSGVLTGPKAANLGQLKKMFPEHVVDGLVIPFGIFREHMDQPMPNKNVTYWQFLVDAFHHAEEMRRSGEFEAAIEQFLLEQLQVVRDEIRRMPLRPEFVSSLRLQFREVLGGNLGSVPVFVRSDTNMEDLKDFTGAGLNLTLFNVLTEETILQGIKDVWASPYSERSFTWRQRYLTNPENVYPSILIIPSVNADYSGVLITKGVVGGDEEDTTVAFNRGVGGAVDGQVAESWLLSPTRIPLLLSPARELLFTSVPPSGGTVRPRAHLNRRILSKHNLRQLYQLSESIETLLPLSEGLDTAGPFDVELGFVDDKIWLFQVRPFVENKQALSSEYLQTISPTLSASKTIQLSSVMQ